MKKLVSFITALAISCTLAISAGAATADHVGVVQPYDGVYEVDPEQEEWLNILPNGDYWPAEGGQLTDIKLVADRGTVTLYFKVGDASYEIVQEQTGIREENGMYSLAIETTGDENQGGYFNYWTDGKREYVGNGVFQAEKGWIELRHLVKTSNTEPDKPIELSESFMKQVTTDSGQYEMYLSGFLTMNLVSGENILTNAEIQAQSISIHVRNTQNGVTRVMTQSTIEGLTVRVSQGGIKELTIKGRVQTSGGTLERYTTVISY